MIYKQTNSNKVDRDSWVDKLTCDRLDDQGLTPGRKQGCSLRRPVLTGPETQSSTYSMGLRASFPLGDAAKRQADHSPAYIVEVKNPKNITSTPPW